MGTSHRLAFTVRVARGDADVAAACEVRATAYGEQAPELGRAVVAPDDLDAKPDTTVVIARSKVANTPVGTVRIVANTDRPLQIERAVPLPEQLRAGVAAEVTRLAVVPRRRDPTLRLALMKAVYLTCLARQVRWIVIGARTPGLVRQYTMLGFTDIVDGGLCAPLEHAGRLPHRVLVFDVTSAERHWHASSHPLYEFMVRTHHPDIDLLATGPDDLPSRAQRSSTPAT